MFGSTTIGDLWLNTPVNVITCLVFIAGATYIAYVGIEATERIQIVLVTFQLGVLVIFAVLAMVKASSSPDGLSFSWSWFDPSALTLSAFVAGLSGSIFAFWGWDTSLTVGEETKDADKLAGRAGLLCVVSILLTYLLVTVATQMFAGVGETGLGLANPEVSDNVFGNLAEPVMGSPLNLLLYLAVLSSAAASLITTFLPTSRTMLGMAAYGALPRRLATLHPAHKTPAFAMIVAGTGAGVFYAVLSFASQSVLTDTILTLGILICLYYGLTAFACIWYFRAELFTSVSNTTFKLVFPLLGGIGLMTVLVVTLRDSASPDYGSGASIGGVGLVLILAIVLLATGIAIMLAQKARHPDFFRTPPR